MSLRTKEEVNAYLSTHDLQAHMQQALQHVVNEQTPEPLLVLSKFFAAKHAEVVKAAYDEAGADRRGDSRWPLGEIFMQFDTDNDGFLNESEFKRALRAIGLPKRTGSQAQLDEFTFRLMDTNKDGVLSVQEFEANLPLALRAKLEAKLDAGWKFDEAKWKASQERHKTTNLAKVFKMFDTEGRGTISDGMLKRAFRALGLKKRSGDKLEMDEAMFKTFDTNGDGVVSLQEFEANCPPAVRALIIEKLEGGWKFDPELWKESMNRHRTVNFAKIFKKFDMDGDGCLDFREMQRAFRAMGMKKRAGANYELDAMTFKRFDANGDGKVSLQEYARTRTHDASSRRSRRSRVPRSPLARASWPLRLTSRSTCLTSWPISPHVMVTVRLTVAGSTTTCRTLCATSSSKSSRAAGHSILISGQPRWSATPMTNHLIQQSRS
jgi:Ca2+-binding EF-hand superfamily protein